ncbi:MULTISPECIES: type VI secretion system Vgr family protein [Variovorax]|jgi:type VI secretion system secreted protein VgrG|uniref:type VI secretion system Vgr family protein n=1 Tax=Variovorax TaxID=34072 RepID=UPI000869EF4A|nr:MULTISPECIES: type VI secretion system tip protein TssI/VgrG [Variovorax]MBN8755487.1 type VI secretion system tip protein VgrG [Variovorax sp.]ODU14117.1 MAG: type VI secretion protein Vgr [Variovorax sp. SCN 67-85]ODV19896.1 MAG: type VI secretion protein Vgr [Variovorax sp. SCN 67-20]OJZ12594.1 MAG: type VI secretion protein Vgr [Variovorax sp. 67-131]UKI09337.1 type VI secretion system tip protein VgrG [Variovorax paradoxus]
MADHEFRIDSDSPVNGELMFWRIAGHEALARASSYELTVLSKSRTLDARDILGRAFDVSIEFEDADGARHVRHCQGHAVRFMRAGHVGRYFEYRIALRSWFWLLTKRINSRILQDKKVLEVLDAVFEDSPIKRFKKTRADNVIGTHEPRRYCVQHQESDYQFLSRLLEDEGIYYWFDAHDAPGTMHLSDASDLAHDKLPAASTLNFMPAGATEPRDNEISRWISERQFDTGKYASRDSNFKSIKKKLEATGGEPDKCELSEFEAFEFAGGYFSGGDADDKGKLRGEEIGARRQRHFALTRWPDVAAGRSFTFKGDPDAARDGDYVIAACTFVASHSGYEGVPEVGDPVPLDVLLREALEDDAVCADTLPVLRELVAQTPALRAGRNGDSAFLLTVMPIDVPFRPPRLTPRVRMPGPQSAIVVGPDGEEIHADDFGRVKVHFHWDRYDKSNEKSTCWVRVSQPWAGKGWGGYFIPRIGQEVIVDFLNGDPDRPLVIGRVYNDDQPIPFGSHTQSGFRTRSTPKGSAANCNEFRFEDKKGSEQVYLHAEKNQDIEVENDETHWVGHDRKKTVDHDETVHVKHDRTETVGNNEKITIGVNRTESVGNNETISIGVNRTETVGSNETITIGSNRTITVGASETATVALQRTHTVGVNETITVGAAQEITVGAVQAVTVGASQTISVGANQSSSIGANRSVDVGANLTTNVGSDEARSVGKGRSTSVGKDDSLSVGKNLVISAGDSISITTGSASITMKKDGTIVIKGKDITIDASGKINAKASSDIVMKGSKILQN